MSQRQNWIEPLFYYYASCWHATLLVVLVLVLILFLLLFPLNVSGIVFGKVYDPSFLLLLARCFYSILFCLLCRFFHSFYSIFVFFWFWFFFIDGSIDEQRSESVLKCQEFSLVCLFDISLVYNTRNLRRVSYDNLHTVIDSFHLLAHFWTI